MNWLKSFLLKVIPFELKRGSSLISILIALVLAGLITKLGEYLLIVFFNLIKLIFNEFGEKILRVLLYSFSINVALLLVGAVVFAILLFPIYRRMDRFLLKKTHKGLIFEEKFINPAAWYLNYWGSRNHNKTNRIEINKMIFEATPDELINQSKCFGAYFDLRNGIYNGNQYEVSCFVRSDNNTTMGFQLWVHNTITGGKLEPPVHETPSVNGETIKVNYTADKHNALRIHLHCKGGTGRIEVNKVSVYKI